MSHAPRPVLQRVLDRSRRELAQRLHQRRVRIAPAQPLVSFTFDDAPRSALLAGRHVLERHGVRGTYYLSLGLLGQPGPSGPIATLQEVREAAQAGHELGCHTYDHLDAWHTPWFRYIDSVDANAQALAAHLPGARFETFAYPRSGAVAAVKPALARRFLCCRHGGQRGNEGQADLNLLQACYLDRHAKASLTFLRHLVERNARARGWLILATHDVAPEPSRWGCTPAFLDAVLRHALLTGSRVLPVREACRVLQG
jgi:peptidoglycan/xylan/chitin deacetylase (PgdA/CDA1 family)